MFRKNTSIFLNKTQEQQKELEYYNQLSKFVKVNQRLVSEFSLGNFEVLIQVFTPELYGFLAEQLYNLEKNTVRYPNYEILRNNTIQSLEGLQQGLLQYSILKNVKAELKVANKRLEILNNVNELQKYIQSLLGGSSLFSKKSVQVIRAELKPQYTEYVRLFGFPKSGVFEIDKLAIASSKIGL